MKGGIRRFLPRRFGKAAAIAAAFGLVSAPAPTIQPVPTAQQQGNDNGKQNVVQAQAPQAVVLERRYAKLGAHMMHPIWLGREKRGNRRFRSRFDYRR